MLAKKGVSPLVATILLIAFAVALGAVVMNWGRAQVEELGIEKGECASDIKLKLLRNSPICYKQAGSNSYVEFTVENNALKEASGLRIWIIGNRDLISIKDFSQTIESGNSFSSKAEYDASIIGNVQQIQFTPKIMVGNEEVMCLNKVLGVSEIDKCR